MQNNLFHTAFDNTKWKNKQKIDELLVLISSTEKIIEKYLKKVETDFPSLTDHSINHSKILWEYADIIVGHSGLILNPVEGFILNSVFLLHDAGMCYSILHNKEDMEKDSYYLDYVANFKNAMLGEKDLFQEALFFSVRQNHGDYALRIATELINGEEFFLGDANIRQEFGIIIGKIAKSHTSNINYIEREFGSTYSSPSFPKDWTIDYKKLAFILRTADAADLDNLRTPKTLKMISEINGDSKNHWVFQKKLGFPKVENDGCLLYSTNTSFDKSEQKAWWYCYNALKVLDTELRDANNYFVTNGQTGFSAKSVKYINDPLELGAHSIKTVGWDSVNTTIRVSNPIHIASELGGIKLYGKKSAAIRELIQNSIDAIHVYRIFTGQDNFAVGKVRLEISKDNDHFYLHIIDNGIGMNQNLLVNELLDFGGSYWKTNKFYYDFKGLKSKGFEAIGRFGIGFFSIFMISDHFTVTSWKYGENIATMKSLEFYDGLNSNPILRESDISERNSIIDRGTAIKIRLESNPYEKNGIIADEDLKDTTLGALVQYYIPSVDVEIHIKELNGEEYHLMPNTIEKFSIQELINYVNLHNKNSLFFEKKASKDKTNEHPLKMIEVIQDGRVLGKLAPIPSNTDAYDSMTTAIVMSKGIRTQTLGGFIGYINTDDVATIIRDKALNVLSYDTLKSWGIKQKEFLKSIEKSDITEKIIKDIDITFGFFDESFPIVRTRVNGKLNALSIIEFKKFLKTVKKIMFAEERLGAKIKNSKPGIFSNVSYSLGLNDIITANDKDKLMDSEKLIRDSVQEIWGDYDVEVENYLFKPNSLYQFSWTFKKK